jgi:hypothetical protein
MGKRGPKSIYSEEYDDLIAESVANKLSHDKIGAAIGVSGDSVGRWIKKNKKLAAKIAKFQIEESLRRVKGIPDREWMAKVHPETWGEDQQGQTVNVTIQMLVDARAVLDQVPGLDGDQTKLLLELKNGDSDDADLPD